MVNAPPCAACGYALRWIPEHHGWGCDRCRQFYPAQQAQAQQPQQQQWAPQHQQPGYGYGGAAVAVPGGGSKIGLWVVLALLVVAGGVVGLVFALRGGGGGMASPEALIKATLAAEADGNVDTLVKLADYPAAFAMAVDCKGEAARDADIDPDKLVKKLRNDMDELVKTTKGLTIELVESKREEGRGDKTEKGKEVAPGCTAKATLEFVSYAIKVKVTKDGKTGEQNTKFEMLDVDGHYFMFKPPRVKPPNKGAAVIDKMSGYKDQMCKCMDKACGDAVQADFMKWMDEMAKEMAAEDKPDEETVKRSTDIMKEYMACQQKLGAT
jgi:hypothetical protein